MVSHGLECIFRDIENNEYSFNASKSGIGSYFMEIGIRKNSIVFFGLVIILVACTPIFNESVIESPINVTVTPIHTQMIKATPETDLFSFSTEITSSGSEDKIAATLFSGWLDHFKKKEIPLEYRIDDFSVLSMTMPLDQSCVEVLGGLFIAQAEVLAKTTLPLASNINEPRSEFFRAGAGNILDDHHLLRIFTAVISKEGFMYTLKIVTQVPLCDKSLLPTLTQSNPVSTEVLHP